LRRERSDVFDKQEYNTILVPYNYIFPCWFNFLRIYVVSMPFISGMFKSININL
jgi:hypothetical protein